MNNNKKIFLSVAVLTASLALSGCSTLFNWVAKKNLDEPTGEVVLAGPSNTIVIRRDDYGVPFVEANDINDLTFGVGYASAEDRLAQMVSMSLLAQGRLAEMAGDVALDMDVYMRTLGIPQLIKERFEQLSPELKGYLHSYTAGVNAYIDTHKKRLPLEMKLTGYQPEPWQAENFIGLFAILNLGVGFNLHEELAFLQFAEKLGADKAAYLAPIYPDESIDFAEANKLSGLPEFSAQLKPVLDQFTATSLKFKRLTGQGLAASNNWAVHASKTKNGASLVANDTHLLLSQPSTWMLMGMKSPEYAGVGVSLPGIPALVAGYNGHIAWGETMVMADSQDVFLEKLRTNEAGKTEYLYQDKWYPVSEREETFKVQGGKDVTLTIQSTRHGPLLNGALKGPSKHAIIPMEVSSEYGLALSTTAQFPDNTMDAFFQLGQAKTIQQAEQTINDIRFIHLNIIAGDKDNILWQVTGNYPNRKAGTGHFPSPGWTGEYDWQGYWGGENSPRLLNPAKGYVNTANDRTVEAGHRPVLTSSWYYPERGERSAQMINEHDEHDASTMVAMQADRHDILVAKVQKLWQSVEWQSMIQTAISELPEQQQTYAQRALDSIMQFNGDMDEDSFDATIWGAFEYLLTRAIFLDELGPEDGDLWGLFTDMNMRAYSGYQDHLLGRKTPEGTWPPFWNNINTAEVESPGQIIADVLSQVWPYLQAEMGKEESQWQWGKLVHYYWQSDSTHMAKHMSGVKKFAVNRLAGYTDRGPYPAGGNRNTLNVAGFDLGSNYNVWNIPAMRMVVDFSQDEPLQLVIAGGQSANPASKHYDDGIQLWLSRENRELAFDSQEKIEQQFNQVKVIKPKL